MTALTFLLATAAILPAVEPAPSEPPVGAECVVWIRKDAYAMDELKFIGQIKAVHKDWIVLHHQPHEVWIPRGMLLFIEITKGTTPAP